MAKSDTLSLADGGTPGGILLDAGTNELEILVFRMGKQRYGVNVAKVREVIRGETPSEPPRMHPSIIGIINKRGALIPLVDLGKHLGQAPIDVDNIEDARIIVTEFNGMTIGFVVESVERIHRVGWDRVGSVPELSDPGGTDSYSTCTGIIKFDEHLLLMVDFESITDSICMEDRLHVTSIENTLGVDRGSVRIIVAEDSAFMRSAIEKAFRASGYTGVDILPDGAAAWQSIREAADSGRGPDVVITDIEMPMMDGLSLTKAIKGDSRFRDMPVILFSSLVTAENKKKGEQVGANIQVAKPDLTQIIQVVDRFVHGGLSAITSAA